MLFHNMSKCSFYSVWQIFLSLWEVEFSLSKRKKNVFTSVEPVSGNGIEQTLYSAFFYQQS